MASSEKTTNLQLNKWTGSDRSQREDFNYDYCKGCGVCAKVCPFHAIEMIDEGE